MSKMYFDSEPSSIENLRRYGKHEAVWFHDWLESSKGVMNDEWVNHVAPYSSLCKYTTELDTSPPLLLVGRLSGQRLLFGDEWAKNAIENCDVPDPHLKKNAVAGYIEALNEVPVVEEVETFIDTGAGIERHTYARIISVIKTQKGFKMFAFFGTPLHRVLQ